MARYPRDDQTIEKKVACCLEAIVHTHHSDSHSDPDPQRVSVINTGPDEIEKKVACRLEEIVHTNHSDSLSDPDSECVSAFHIRTTFLLPSPYVPSYVPTLLPTIGPMVQHLPNSGVPRS